MLVMAVEAAHQMADKRRSVKGFKITDVSFHTPLNLTLDPTGVETMFYLRPVKEALEGGLYSLDFKLCVFGRDEWTENCRGTIKIAYQDSPGEVDEGKEANEEIRHHRKVDDDASLSCTQSIDSKILYGRLRDLGYGYGPTFQLLEAVRFSDGRTATAEVKVSQATASNARAHVIHPTSLDAMMQLVFATLLAGKEALSTMVPTYIRKMWVSNSGLQDPDNAAVRVVAASIPRGYRGIEAYVSVMDGIKSNFLLEMEGLEMTIVSSPEVSALPDMRMKQLCSHLEYKPALALLKPSQILQYCESAQKGGPDPVDFFEDLTLLLLMFISRALESIRTSESQILDSHYQRYIAWMQMELERFQSGQLPHSRPEWKVSLQDEEYFRALCNRVSSVNNQGKLYTAVGENLVRMLDGKLDPLDLLFNGDLAREFYQELNNSSNCSHAFGRYLDALAHENPKMRILEIGAGTGSMTSSVLDVLTKDGDTEGTSRFDHYDFTDISPSFFENASKTFTDHRRIQFSVLDIEKDPGAQGFNAGSYDMIVASNVLHATKDLRITIDHVRKLLKPGGKLALFEVTEPQIVRGGFVFGLLPGWWLASEDYRQWSPCISTKSWHELLVQQGFSGSEIVFRDFQSDCCHESSIILSTAIEDSQQAPGSLFPKTMIVTGDAMIEGPIAPQLGVELRSKGVPDLSIQSLHRAASMDDLGEVFCIVLCELEEPLLYHLNPEEFNHVRHLLTCTKGILWVTRGGGTSAPPGYGMIDGLARVLRTEGDKSLVVTLAIDVNGTFYSQHVESILKVFMSTVAKPTITHYEPAYTEVDGMLHINRIVESGNLNQEILKRTLPEQSESNIKPFGAGPALEVCIKSPGSLETLCWVADTKYALYLAPDEVEVEVKAVGLNFMDCLAALGQVNFKRMGSECAGVVTRVGRNCEFTVGERVCVANLDSFKTFARSCSQNIVRIPDGLSDVEAASLPTTFITAYYSLHEVGRLRKTESVLIHSGAGGTGQAAIQVALHLGAEVFTTVGSKRKKKIVMDLYGILEDHIFYSRDLSFAQGIKRVTKGKGVDVVLNSLAGEGLVASWECIAPYGRFLEIGKKDIFSHQRLPMFQFAKNVTFSAIDIASMELERPWLIQETLNTILGLVMAKKLRPVHPLHVYKISDLEQAFRYMQSGQNDGKIVLEVKKDDPVPVSTIVYHERYGEAKCTCFRQFLKLGLISVSTRRRRT